MRLYSKSKIIESAVTGAIVTHVVATMIQNTPDSFNQDVGRFFKGWTIPGWRFFAPNPGVQNVHLLIRTRDRHNPKNVTTWVDCTPVIQHKLVNMFWNPKSRGPKALFDAMQQLSVMSGNYVDFRWAVDRSESYEIIMQAAWNYARSSLNEEIQFMLLNEFPSNPEEERVKPVVTSYWFGAGEISPAGTVKVPSDDR